MSVENGRNVFVPPFRHLPLEPHTHLVATTGERRVADSLRIGDPILPVPTGNVEQFLAWVDKVPWLQIPKEINTTAARHAGSFANELVGQFGYTEAYGLKTQVCPTLDEMQMRLSAARYDIDPQWHQKKSSAATDTYNEIIRSIRGGVWTDVHKAVKLSVRGGIQRSFPAVSSTEYPLLLRAAEDSMIQTAAGILIADVLQKQKKPNPFIQEAQLYQLGYLPIGPLRKALKGKDKSFLVLTLQTEND